ncbi:MAG: helix-turn-helix domain-containing protein [Oscillospiraceae bacterium]|nr:helix-turn-helix domain-containing protein [Oscillospiraceae bacterium]
MNQNTKIFDQRLKEVLSASLVERGELARHLGVSVPTVNRWLNGISTPNVYQFREIAHFFGLPYEWFTEDEGDIPDVDDLAVKLGLSPETVETLLELVSEGGNEATLEAVDNTLCAALAVIEGVFEDLDRFADNVVAGMEGLRSDKG